MADRPIFSWRIVGAAMLLSLPFIAVSLDKGGDDPSVLNAEPMPKAGRSLLLDIARTDAGYVVVGERGHPGVDAEEQDLEDAVERDEAGSVVVIALG